MSVEVKKMAWLDWYACALKLALAALVVFGVYGWNVAANRKQDALCEVAQQYVESLEDHAEPFTGRRQELKRAKKVVSDACDQSDDFTGD